MTLRHFTISVTTVRCFCVSVVWHSVKVNKLSHVWQFIDLDLHTTELRTAFRSNNTMTRLNIDIFLLWAVILQCSNLIPASFLYFQSLLYCLYFDLVSISGFVAYIAMYLSVFHVLYWCTAVTVSMWLLTREETFVMVWMCRQFIWGKDWNW